MSASDWTSEFGPFGPDEKPISYEQIPATVALRDKRPFTGTSVFARRARTIRMWQRARFRSSDRVARAAGS